MNEIEQKRTVDDVIDWVKTLVAAKRTINPELWLDISFRLNLLLDTEHTKLEDLRTDVARKKLEIMKRQEKRNVAAADLETEASDEYRELKLQEHKVDRIEEFIKIAKINGNQY